jgi:hypothetical protein
MSLISLTARNISTRIKTQIPDLISQVILTALQGGLAPRAVLHSIIHYKLTQPKAQ